MDEERINQSAVVAPRSLDGGDILKKLARTVVKLFYQPKDLLILDMIIKEERITEKRLEDVLQFDRPLLRTSLLNLKNDRVIAKTIRLATGIDGKTTRVDVYYVPYGKLANIVKYKLDNVRRRLDTLERDANTMKSFRCQPCNKSWTDLEAGELFNVDTYLLRCNLCGRMVKEDVSDVRASSRLVVAKFNEQAGPLYDLLKQAEDVYPSTD
ncbi:unnamed protein product [Orchesella dallaii]|uniref:Transcription initiation factor IIE subunit alpha N-terminal domain-containing protein n=1 Tax=Orchesella dallaii TaxID=48710 RepID=A0ABP1PLS3_9HEXA